MENNKTPVFEVFIVNSIKRRPDGERIGAWMGFPADKEQMKETFERIGVDGDCKEWFIKCYHSDIVGLVSELGEKENLNELNYLAMQIQDMQESSGWKERLEAILKVTIYEGNAKNLINLTLSIDEYTYLPDVKNEEELGRYLYDAEEFMGLPDAYVDYKALGRDAYVKGEGMFTCHGYACEHGFKMPYAGIDQIPESFKIVSDTPTGKSKHFFSREKTDEGKALIKRTVNGQEMTI